MGRRLAAVAAAIVMMVSCCAVGVAGTPGAVAGDPEEEVRASARTSLTAATKMVGVPSAQTDMLGRTLPAGFYFYRDLLNDEQQEAYDAICIGMLRAQESIDIGTHVNSEDVTAIVSYVLRDHPEIFWSANEWAWTMDADGAVLVVEPKYNELALNLDEARATFERAANPVINFAATFESDEDKVRAVHDWIVHNASHVAGSPYNQTAWSVFVNGRSVCAGYAAAFQYVLQKLGIPAAYVTGESGGEAHAWNLVMLDGKMYAVDATFDDPLPEDPNRFLYTYFLVSDEQLAADHARDELSSPLPVATEQMRGSFSPTDLAGLDPNATRLPQARIQGDVAGDGGPTLRSLVLSVRYVAGLETLTDAQRQAADMNADGRVALSDALRIAAALKAAA